MLKDISISAIVAGLMAVLISYSGPAAIFFQAAQNANISTEMMASWIWAISIGAAVSGIVLSVWYKIPIVTAWSAPGTVLLVTLFPELSLNEAVGAYITAAIIVCIIGVTGVFDKVIGFIPPSVAAAMMAGILFNFGLGAFTALDAIPEIAFAMIIACLLLKKYTKAYSLILLVVLGVVLSFSYLDADFSQFKFSFAIPQLITPEWSLSSTLSLAIPLVVVSLTGQFLPGFAVLKSSGYRFSTRSIVGFAGLVSIPTALFGGITTVIAAITASLCTGSDAHENPDKRYIAGVANGVFYLIGGTLGGSIVLFFTTFPKEMIAIIAGLALLGAISNSLVAALQDKEHLDAALITFMTTCSGVEVLGIGSAFWGVVMGTLAYVILHKKVKSKKVQPDSLTSP